MKPIDVRSRFSAAFLKASFASLACACALPLSAGAKQAIRIAHIADPQIGFVTRRFPERSEACYEANYTADLQRVEAMIPIVNAERPDLVVIAGDLVQWSKDLEAEWPRLMKKFTAPVLVVPGNHDLGQKGALSTVHREHLKRFVRVFGAAWGSRVVKGWRVIGVNSSFWQKLDGTAEVASAKDRHAAWLDCELAAAKANGEEPVVVSHIPPYVKSVDEPDSNHCIAQAIRRPLLDKAIGAGARFWLCGHEHVRSVQRYSTLTILTGEAVCANLDRSPAGFNILSIPADGPDYEWKKIRIR